MKVRLSVQHQKANVRTVVLHADAVIGRSTDCNLRLASGQVSRQHCQLLVSDDRVAIVDLGSSNGTFLNGTQIKPHEETPIPSGAELEIGPVKFTVDYDDPNAETSIRKQPPDENLLSPSNLTPPGGVAIQTSSGASDAEREVFGNEFDDGGDPPESEIAPHVPSPPTSGRKPLPVAKPATKAAPPPAASQDAGEESPLESETLAENPGASALQDEVADTRHEFQLDDEGDSTRGPLDETLRVSGPPAEEALAEEFESLDSASEKPERHDDDDFMKFLNNLDE